MTEINEKPIELRVVIFLQKVRELKVWDCDTSLTFAKMIFEMNTFAPAKAEALITDWEKSIARVEAERAERQRQTEFMLEKAKMIEALA